MQVKRIYKYPLDLRGVLDTNLISGEVYEINAAELPIVVAREGDFFGDTLKIKDGSTGGNLVPEVDFAPVCFDIDATEAVGGRPCYGAFKFLRPEAAPSKILVEYRLVGGEYVNRVAALIDTAINVLEDKRQSSWENILNKPTDYPPKLHNHYLSEITDFGALIQAIRDNTEALLALMAPMQNRLSTLIYNLDNSNRAEHNSILALITHLNNQVGDLYSRSDRLQTIVDNPMQSFDMFALKSIRVNGHSLHNDVQLSAEDVDAVSATRGGVFWNSFVDNRTNYGRMSNSPSTHIYNKDQIDNMLPGTMIPVWKDQWNDNFLPMSPGLGQLHKYTTDRDNFREWYMVMLFGAGGDVWFGFAASATTINWTRVLTGSFPDPIPPGTLLHYLGTQPPPGYFVPLGQDFDGNLNPQCARLFPNWKLPDMRGMFLRMIDYGAGRDPNRDILSHQGDAIRPIFGEFAPISETFGSNGGYGTGPFAKFEKDANGTPRKVDWSKAGGVSFDISRVHPVGNEVRPINVAVNYIIRGG